MVARGALIKPWIFREIEEGVAFEPTAVSRVAIYRRLASYMKEHFRDDAKGRDRAMRFLPWHLGFFWRYGPLPEAEFAEQSMQHPLLQTRHSNRSDAGADVPLLEAVLCDPREKIHQRLADVLWIAADDASAVAGFERVGRESPPDVDVGGAEIVTSCR